MPFFLRNALYLHKELMAVTEEFQNVHTPHDKGYKKSRGGIVCGNKQAVVDEIVAQAGNGDDNMAFEYTFIREFKEELEEMKKQGWEEGVAAGKEEGRMEGRAEGRTEGIAEGKIEGRAEGRIEATLELLEELGEISEQLEQKIREQSDLNVLRKWHKAAASATGIEDFEEKIAD